jgi:AraC family transcriptional regulator, regulatory protein of adaptative response / methylated-DNA-[protein]-cysteine methyltransferase
MTHSTPFTNEKSRWQAVVENDSAADSIFYYGVITTGIFCRPSCPSKLPNRKNTIFFDTIAEAISAGYRPCKRCQPQAASPEEQTRDTIVRACRILEERETSPKLADLAKEIGMSPYHFHRLFKKTVGITPKQYSSAHRSDHFKRELASGQSVTDAMYSAGYSSSSTAYTSSRERLAMKPKEYRKGGAGLNIRYGIVLCRLGWVIVAVTDRGICAIEFADDPEELPPMVQRRFPMAEIVKEEQSLNSLLHDVVQLIDSPGRDIHLPLDIQGTAFQQQVWAILRQIEPGETLSYTDVADKLGKPKAVRAVATACAANKIAVVIPCHRVILKTGEVSGYRWGIERKKKLLEIEREE